MRNLLRSPCRRMAMRFYRWGFISHPRAVVVGESLHGSAFVTIGVEEFEKDFYRVRYVHEDRHPDAPICEAFYTRNWDSVGIDDESFVRKLAKEGTIPERRKPSSSVCSIGYSKKKKCWMGYSHRGMAYFPVGHVVRGDDDILVKYMGYPDPYEIKDLAGSRRAACDFAEGVN